MARIKFRLSHATMITTEVVHYTWNITRIRPHISPNSCTFRFKSAPIPAPFFSDHLQFLQLHISYQLQFQHNCASDQPLYLDYVKLAVLLRGGGQMGFSTSIAAGRPTLMLGGGLAPKRQWHEAEFSETSGRRVDCGHKGEHQNL